jgi:hypothetical protein
MSEACADTRPQPQSNIHFTQDRVSAGLHPAALLPFGSINLVTETIVQASYQIPSILTIYHPTLVNQTWKAGQQIPSNFRGSSSFPKRTQHVIGKNLLALHLGVGLDIL